jgi:hypothetical protein
MKWNMNTKIRKVARIQEAIKNHWNEHSKAFFCQSSIFIKCKGILQCADILEHIRTIASAPRQERTNEPVSVVLGGDPFVLEQEQDSSQYIHIYI